MANYQFQTEVNQLLKLIIHSLYSNKDIFLREIISNASDALDKLKYLNLSQDEYKGLTFDPRIDISFDEDKHILTVKDNGIGMNSEDLSANLGTIASSGTKAFMEKLTGDAQKNSDLIGQFGVGFYSAFMASSRIDVYTRKALETQIWHWSSDGTNSYDIEELPQDSDASRLYGYDNVSTVGTVVVMTLNEDSYDYAMRYKLEELVKRYSDHIAFPIYLHYSQKSYDDKGNVTGSEAKVDKINSASALWKRSKSELKPEDYNDFYKTLAHDGSDPLHYVHTHAEGTQEYTTLFYIPRQAPFDMYNADYKSGLKLYVKRVFITDDDRELLPAYLRFVRGIIDSEDLPLNVSREILQQNRILEAIKTQSVKKLLGEFKAMAEAAEKASTVETPTDEDKKAIADWNTFVKEFNRPMKEGLYSDYANRDELATLVRFKTTADLKKPVAEGEEPNEWTSFGDYVSRMQEGQKSIYYIAGSDEKALRSSPLLEAYKARGIEVLIASDEIDDIVLTSYGRYEDYDIKSVDRANSDEELGVDKAKAEEKEKELKPVVDKVKGALGDRVKDVRLSKRLSDSASCIVIDENDPTVQMERMFKAMGQKAPEVKPILEINGDHTIVQRLKDSSDEGYIKDVSSVLLDEALLVSDRDIEDKASFVASLNRLLSK